jgi:putative nucleotidyltransferase with HDIG domain
MTGAKPQLLPSIADQGYVRLSPRLLAVPLWILAAGGVTGAAATSQLADWTPVGLVGLLLVISIASDALGVETRGMRLSGSFIAIVLAMALLGPAPAVAIALATIAVDTWRAKPPAIGVAVNFASHATYPLIGALIVRVAHGDTAGPWAFGLIILGAFAASNLYSFALLAIARRLATGAPLHAQVRDVFLPLVTSEGLAAVLAVAIVLSYEAVGFAAMTALVIVLFMFQVLARELLLSRDRAEELEQRSQQLGALQVGVLATLIQTLALRDKMTARHSAAVARYTKSIAQELGLDEEQQDLAHTAGLLHDIGKFIFPDNILFADRKLTEADWEIVKKHPAQGARLVRRVDGYGPVADIILAHHERMDGSGYPNNLPAHKIPLISRMISVADTFDVMTARDSYRRPVPRSEAIAELRRVSGTQLDGDVVEAFIRLLDRRELAFQHTTDADFEAELGFKARVARFASRRAA